MAGTSEVNKDRPTTRHPSTHQGWHYLALAVGSLVLGLGIFGGVGLLQSHGLISISKPVASFLGKLGATPHHVSLWVTAVGGISAGGALCVLSVYNISKKNPKPFETYRESEALRGPVGGNARPQPSDPHSDNHVTPTTNREATPFD